jgi:uncharacterized protein YcbK (DUF882 family)
VKTSDNLNRETNPGASDGRGVILGEMVRVARSRALSLSALAFVAACARTAGSPVVSAAPIAVATEAVDAPLFGPPKPEGTAPEAAWAKALDPLRIECANTGAKAVVQLYGADGSVDPEAIDTFSRIAADSNGPFPLSDRLVQLAVKASHYFGVSSLSVVSAYRKPRARGSKDHHSKGEALDFRLPGIDYRQLAAYLRSLPKVGVGVYTNPRTHFVHLDVRDESFHWLDASPPGVVWREAALPDKKRVARDAAYSVESDLPLDRKGSS